MERFEKILFGNGKGGILDRLARIETKLYFIYAGIFAIIIMLIRLLTK